MNSLNEAIGKKAKRMNLAPYFLKNSKKLDKMPPYPFPNLGTFANHYDEIMEEVETFFVDSSGFGREGEPALTQKQFHEALKELIDKHPEGLYIAISGEGQFQIYITAWKKKKETKEEE